MKTRGIIYIAFGQKHRRQAKASIESLQRFGNMHPVIVYTDCPNEFTGDTTGAFLEPLHHQGSMRSRYYKTMIHRLSPWDFTLFLDSDTLSTIDTLGNTWTPIQIKTGASADAGGAGMWIATVAATGFDTITFNGGSARCTLCVLEYVGVFSASPVDVSAASRACYELSPILVSRA